MCTWVTMTTEVHGSGKGPEGRWIKLTDATVSFDHPQHSTMHHSLNIDLLDKSAGPSARIAVELSAESALRLVEAIKGALAAVDEAVLVDC